MIDSPREVPNAPWAAGRDVDKINEARVPQAAVGC